MSQLILGKENGRIERDLTPIFLMSNILVEPGMNFYYVLPKPKSKRKTVLKVKCLREAFHMGSKGALVSW